MVVDSLISDLGGSGDPPFLCYPVRTVKKSHMSVNLEVKGSLAKCLATENLIIEHKKVSTASFDVDRRVLVLPMWDRASSTVYDLLVGHEVGHALFTDNIDWTKEYSDVPKDFINVIEDVRVERLMKKKYPGLSKTFYTGYNELNNDDFFSVKDENLNDLSFIDRINMYFKIGAFHNIAFSDEENQFVTRISQLETFKEVLDIAREIVQFLNYKKKQFTEMPEIVQNTGQGGEEVDLPQDSEQNNNQDSIEIDQQSEQSSSTDGESQGENPIIKHQEAPNGGGSDPSNQHGDFESKTSKSFDEKSQDLTDKYSEETTYADLPEFNLDKLIIPNHYVHSATKQYYEYSNQWVKDWYNETEELIVSFPSTEGEL